MGNRQKIIYETDGDRYEALISREDYQGNIMLALEEIVKPDDLDVLDLGAGTGRLTLLIAQRARTIRAFDASEEMLRVCRTRLEASGLSNWQIDVADHRQLPVEARSVDLVVSGWSICYLAVWHPETWRAELQQWLREMSRVLRPGGFMVLFETLGVGTEIPVRLQKMESYFLWLDEAGFQNKWIRTDCKFASVEEAAELTGFFLGDDVANKVRRNNSTIVPECTGVWWKQL